MAYLFVGSKTSSRKQPFVSSKTFVFMSHAGKVLIQPTCGWLELLTVSAYPDFAVSLVLLNNLT